MAVVIKFLKGVRNHWKKSTFAAVCLTYGGNYAKNVYETNILMKDYCLQALEYGKQPLPDNTSPKTITVILNPNANKRKALKNFEKYCAPILYLAGMCVDVIQTESEGHAKDLIEELEKTDGIVVAGGDGTLSEVVSGLMKRLGDQSGNNVPLGILPLGKHNTVGNTLFSSDGNLKEVKILADASLAVVEGYYKPADVMKIEVIENDVPSGKSVYAVSDLKWGAFRDAETRKDKYWYFGPLRKYATYLINGFKNDLSWNCNAVISYTLPCNGCTNCRETKVQNTRWYHRLIFKRKVEEPLESNDRCQKVYEKEISTVDLALFTRNVIANFASTFEKEPAKLCLSLGPQNLDYTNFVSLGWKSENGHKRPYNEIIEAKQIEIKPKEVKKGKEFWYSIDNEDYEVKPVKITLLPKALNMFCKKSDVEKTE